MPRRKWVTVANQFRIGFDTKATQRDAAAANALPGPELGKTAALWDDARAATSSREGRWAAGIKTMIF
jgi:hypothetical protein